MPPTYLLTSTPPEPPEPQGNWTNPYHKLHILAYVPTVVIMVCSGILTTPTLLDQPGAMIGVGALFVIATFCDFLITDSTSGLIRRRWFERFIDSYLPLLLLFGSTGVSIAVTDWSAADADGRVFTVFGVLLAIFAVLFTVREMGALGSVVNPKTLLAMDEDVREALPYTRGRLNLTSG